MKLIVASNRYKPSDIVKELNRVFTTRESMEMRISLYLADICEQFGLHFIEKNGNFIIGEKFISMEHLEAYAV